MDSEGFPTKGDQQTIKDFSWGDAVWKVFTSQIDPLKNSFCDNDFNLIQTVFYIVCMCLSFSLLVLMLKYLQLVDWSFSANLLAINVLQRKSLS